MSQTSLSFQDAGVELEAIPRTRPSPEVVDALEHGDLDESTLIGGFSLKPTDRGKEAWQCLFASFLLEGLVWGFPSSFGVFQEYYGRHDLFADSDHLAIIGACAAGIMYLGIPFVFAIVKSFPYLRAWATPVGLIIVCVGLALSSFATSVNHLILTQGVIYAVGGCIAWTPIISFIDEWWVRRRGLAYGIVMAATGLSGAIMPIITEWLLQSYGFRTTLRICALMFVIVNIPSLFFLKPRIPLAAVSHSRRFDLSFWKYPTYLIHQSGNIIQSLGFFLPVVYLPTFAKSMGASNFQSILTVVLLNAASFVGCMTMGFAVDRYKLTTCISICALGSGVSVFFLWGFANSLPLLYVFCIIYGAFAGSNPSTYSAVVRDTREKIRTADSGLIFAILGAGKGVGNLCSGPLSTTLLQPAIWNAKFNYGGGYGAMIVFTGTASLMWGWSFVAMLCGWI